jgi:hypothetical protein
MLLLPAHLSAQSVSELKDKAQRFQSDSESLYRLDDDDHQQIWEAYCGVFDPKIQEDREFAADIARQLQSKETGIIEQLLGHDLSSLLEGVKKITDSSDASSEDKNEAKAVEEALRNQEKKLHDLYNGVPLKGSSHPFVQYAIEYGKKQHTDMCGKFGNTPRVCDQDFSGIRPDLVVVDSGHLVVYEFKPDNSKAKSRGWKQVADYLPVVVNYYQQYFEDGRNGGFKGEPPSDYGGAEILKILKNSPDAWSSDGKTLLAIPQVQTYSMCDKKFN